MFGSGPGLHPLDASALPPRPGAIKNVSRQGHMSPGGENHPSVKSAARLLLPVMHTGLFPGWGRYEQHIPAQVFLWTSVRISPG